LIFKNGSWQVSADRYKGWSRNAVVAYGNYDGYQEYGTKQDSGWVFDSLSINITDFQLHSTVSSQLNYQQGYVSILGLYDKELMISPHTSSVALRIINIAGQN